MGDSLFTETAVKDISIFDLNVMCTVGFVFEARSRTSLKLVIINEFPRDTGGGGSFLPFTHGILIQNEDLPSYRYRLNLSNQKDGYFSLPDKDVNSENVPILAK